jgi:hypothetical protein
MENKLTVAVASETIELIYVLTVSAAILLASGFVAQRTIRALLRWYRGAVARTNIARSSHDDPGIPRLRDHSQC